MAYSDVTHRPLDDQASTTADQSGGEPAERRSPERYRPLPTGSHGLDPELVKHDQRERLRAAIVELIAEKGYPSVRIVDLAKLAHVSQPTFYTLFADKEELFLSAYDQIAQRTGQAILQAYNEPGPQDARLRMAMRAFAELAVAEPPAMSLFMLGAFGAGSTALERRRRTLDALEGSILASRDRAAAMGNTDLTVKGILGGIREVTAARLREGRQSELPSLVEDLAIWAASYPRKLPNGLGAPPSARSNATATAQSSKRARRAEGRLPSGRSDLPRQFIVKSQRERIVDATAAIIAEKGLGGLTIPEIAKRANVSNQTFYSIYKSKRDAFLGAQKIGMHQALQVAVEAYDAQNGHWARAVTAGVRALLDYLASEPAHAHLNLVDTFAVSPEAIEIRNAAMQGFAVYLQPGYELAAEKHIEVPAVAAEAITGGIWQVLHHYVESGCTSQLPLAAPQLSYMALTPFLGPVTAAEVARTA
ncbi:MAG: TetR/AcrR family transcriptional regulator [Solirubrobacteraceae bacterium]